MKELSIEEKAKAYDEAINVAEKYHNGTLKDVMETIFPKLMENEDERIRKALIRFHKSTIDVDGIKGEDIVAWLEKQGEHANFRNKIQIGDKVTRNEDGVLVNLSQLKRVAKKDEKQGEQKPNFCHHEVDLSNCSEEYRKAYYDGWNNCNMQHSQCKSELDDVIKCLINGMKFYYESNEEATWGTDKWSMPVKHIIEVLEAQVSQNFANSGRTCKDEQKTCKDEQKRWKPSDKQLEVLKEACDEHCEPDGLDPLYTLYQDLKKLKE